MPGRIVRIHVDAGAHVRRAHPAGDPGGDEDGARHRGPGAGPRRPRARRGRRPGAAGRSCWSISRPPSQRPATRGTGRLRCPCPGRSRSSRSGRATASRTRPPRSRPTSSVGFIDRLGAAGLRVIEATSFVHPRAVPQLADADALFPSIDRRPGVRYPVLVPDAARPRARRRRRRRRDRRGHRRDRFVQPGEPQPDHRGGARRCRRASSPTPAARSMRVRGLRVGRVRLPVRGRGGPGDDRRRGRPAARPRLRRDQPGRHDRGGDPRRRRARPRRRAARWSTSGASGCTPTTRAARPWPTSTRRSSGA